jgi:hypothetical protein
MYRVKGNGIDQTTPDQALATKSLADYNAPEAVASRQAGVLRASGAPDKAMSLENSLSTSKLNKIKLNEAEQQQADAKWRRDIGSALTKPGETALSGLVDLFSNSEFGPMAGKKAKAVASPDGKMVTIHTVNPDGSVTPTSMQFSNDQNGAIQAAYLLDQSVSPKDRYEGWVSEVKNLNKASKDKKELEIAEKNAESNRIRANNTGRKSESEGGPGGNIQKTFADNDGYMVGVFRDGTSKRLTDPDGKPIRSDNIEKRVDALAKNLQTNSREYRRMPYADVRKAAQNILLGESSAAPGLDSGTPAKPAQASPAIPEPASKAEYDKLPKGSQYRHPSGEVRIKG